MRKAFQLSLMLAAGVLAAGAARASVLVSTLGIVGDANAVFEQQFTYNPAMGGTLIIQTYGYGGSSNAFGGTNLAGQVISAGGFDPMIALYSGGIGSGGARIAANDDQGSTPTFTPCGPGSGANDSVTGFCRDARLVLSDLSGGTYTLALSVFANTPPATETSAYPNTGDFNGRTSAFAVDVSAVPEPLTSMLLGSGLLVLGALARRRRS
jgi:hypothetical protein